jgi:phenylpyruvate tautomerase PptA (4-oxalocrotonate tautomerase family)
MPLYRCSSPAGRLNDSQREQIARAFTEIHCDLTGAPPTFVHAQFHHHDAAQGAPEFILHAGIRAGRDEALVGRLIQRCTQAVAQIAQAEPDRIRMRTSSTPASWILEGGRVLPEPGEEEDWLAATTGGSEGAEEGSSGSKVA